MRHIHHHDHNGKPHHSYQHHQRHHPRRSHDGQHHHSFPAQSEDWQEQMIYILSLEHGDLTEQDMREKYRHEYAITKPTISTPNVIKWFKKCNQESNITEQIKPFSFLLKGQATADEVVSVTPYQDKFQQAPHKPFINYKHDT